MITFRQLHYRVFILLSIGLTSLPFAKAAENDKFKRPMEYLDRGLVAMESPGQGTYLSWRMLGTDPIDIGFNVYKNGKKINTKPIVETTNYEDKEGSINDKYVIETVLKNGRNEKSEEVAVWPKEWPIHAGNRRGPVPYKILSLDPPEGELTPGDMSAGDLDGDGKYELVFMWEGDGPCIEAIDLNGKSRWRISCGPNVTTNHSPFLVYDLDGDGKAEVTCLTAPGTKDGAGNYLSKGPAAEVDHSVILKRVAGNLMEDPAFITVFDGETGVERETILFWPPIGPAELMHAAWGDDYGNRASRIMAAVLFHKEKGPLVVFSRGIYSRIAMKAYAFDGKRNRLKIVWTFDTEDPSGEYTGYRAQGNHSLAVGDVDDDGSDELIYGACAIDHNGKGLYTTGRGHGDSHAFGDLDPDNPGLEFFQGHESGEYGVTMRVAGTGEILWKTLNKGDIGRAWASDVDPRYPGSECVALGMKDRDSKGNEIPTSYDLFGKPVYFSGTATRGMLRKAGLDGEHGRVFTAWHFEAMTVHHTKCDACLVADIIGDWREEVVYLCRRDDKPALLILSTWIPTNLKNYTLMHDPTYRMNIVVQNIEYNQHACLGYNLADGAPVPNIKLIKYPPKK